MSQRIYRRIERVIIALMLVGIVGMFQPFILALYRYGFLLLLFSTLSFIVISHLAPVSEATDAVGPLSLEHGAEQRQAPE